MRVNRMADFLQQGAAVCNILQPDCLCRRPVFSTPREVCQVHEHPSQDCLSQDQDTTKTRGRDQDKTKIKTKPRLRPSQVLELAGHYHFA